MEDVAADLGIPKATLFSHFGSKDALFLEVYKTAASSLPAYLDAPDEVVSAGFFATLRYWLEATEHLVAEDWLPYRITLIGNHAVDLSLKRSINRWLAQTDPYGTAAFVRLGRDRGELRDDVDPATISALVDWVVERVQDALVTEELDAGLFRRPGAADDAIRTPLEEFLVLLGDAVGARTR
jgi:AcrR family transcriptional regulator